MADWDRRFIELAKHIGKWSKDRSRQVGCVVVDSKKVVRALGYNGFPRGLDDNDDTRHVRPEKYLWTEHAERNAIYQAARTGNSVDGCTMYLAWFPCVDCARAIVQAGIVELVATRPDLSDAQWGHDFSVSTRLLEEAGIRLRYVED